MFYVVGMSLQEWFFSFYLFTCHTLFFPGGNLFNFWHHPVLGWGKLKLGKIFGEQKKNNFLNRGVSQKVVFFAMGTFTKEGLYTGKKKLVKHFVEKKKTNS